jgi:hypothetical protein
LGQDLSSAYSSGGVIRIDLHADSIVKWYQLHLSLHSK